MIPMLLKILPKDNQNVLLPVILILSQILLSHKITNISSQAHGIKPSDSGISKQEIPPVDLLATPKKSIQSLSPQIIDKSSPQELIEKSNSGTLLLIANIPQKKTIIMIGYHVSDIPLLLKLQINKTLSHPISPVLVGTEDWKFGAPISKLEPVSKLMNQTSTMLALLLMVYIWPLVVKIKKSMSGIF